MTIEIALVLAILLIAILFLIFEWLPMEVVALLVMGSVVIFGLVQPVDALAGFSNPAVVTVWAVFILSGGLTRTGVANIIGRVVLKLSGPSEAKMVTVIMLSAGVMSAFMNNVAVAALMLPVIMDIARKRQQSPARLLLPLAYGSLLGGLTTLIGTPPNILVSDALRDSGLPAFKLFDYTPVGLVVMTAGVAFMVLVGRHLLPQRSISTDARSTDWRAQYRLTERMYVIKIPEDSPLVNKSLAESRIGSALGLTVLGITRQGRTLFAPGPSVALLTGDELIVEGGLDQLQMLQNWRQLISAPSDIDTDLLSSDFISLAEVPVLQGSVWAGQSVFDIGFRTRFGLNILAVYRQGRPMPLLSNDIPLKAGDLLLAQGPADRFGELRTHLKEAQIQPAAPSTLIEKYDLLSRLLVLKMPSGSPISGQSLSQLRLGDALGLQVFVIVRKNGELIMPDPDHALESEDRVVVLGRKEDLEIIRGLEELQINPHQHPDLQQLESEAVGVMEAILSPHTTLAGKTLRQLHFREKYGLNVLAIWREGQARRSQLRDLPLRLGDALLVHGSRDKLRVLGHEPDFIVLTEALQEAPRLHKAKLSTLIMAAVLVPVIIGWLPIYIAAVIGAACMVMTRCLTMEEAYRYIEWKAVFLIAGMLPLGTALDQSGAARYLAQNVVEMVGPYGPTAVMFGLVALTFLATCFIPTAALVVLMAPIVMSTANDLGVSVQAYMMAIAMAASASFITPISHPANILVMGPGGYRFADYVKVGGLLTLVIMVVIILVVPRLWPI